MDDVDAPERVGISSSDPASSRRAGRRWLAVTPFVILLAAATACGPDAGSTSASTSASTSTSTSASASATAEAAPSTTAAAVANGPAVTALAPAAPAPAAPAAPAPIGATVPAGAAAKVCRGADVAAVIGGVAKCLTPGQECESRHVPDYTAAGFTCTLINNRYLLHKVQA